MKRAVSTQESRADAARHDKAKLPAEQKRPAKRTLERLDEEVSRRGG